VDWVRNHAVGRPRAADGIAAVLVDSGLPDAGFDEAFDGLFALTLREKSDAWPASFDQDK
jgi:hypothetical protein